MWARCATCSILTKTGIYWQVKFQEILFVGSRVKYMWTGRLSTLYWQIADTLHVIYTRSNVLKSTYEDTLQHRHIFKGIQEHNIPTVCCKNMEAVTWVFPNPAKFHCSPRVPFQRVLAMVEDEKPLFCTLFFFFSLSLSLSLCTQMTSGSSGHPADRAPLERSVLWVVKLFLFCSV